MADVCRRHAVINAPIDQVWPIVSDPRTHPDWWPEVVHVQDAEDGGEYTRVTKRFGFLDAVDTTWVAEPMEHMKEVNFRCTVTGTYTRFALTPAQDDTFVEVEAGVVPIGVKGRMVKTVGPRLLFPGWIRDLLDALPKAVEQKKQPA